MKRILSAAISCGVLGVAVMSAPPLRAQDASVAQRLETAGMKYEVDGDGDFKVTYSYSTEGRTQLVFVSGTTEIVSGLTIREVFAPAALIDKDAIDGAKALQLMRDSGQSKLGSWEIRGNILYFVIKVFDQITASELEAAMDIAAEVADDKEIELTSGRDDY